MRIIDRYISHEFLYSLFASIFICTIILLIFLITSNIDDILGNNVSITDTIRFLIYSIPYTIVQIIPIAVVIAVLFSVGGMSKHNEILAMVTSGVSKYRFLLPLAILGVIISFLTIFFNESIVPVTQSKANDIKQRTIRGKKILERGEVFVKGRGNRFYSMTTYISNPPMMIDPVIEDVNDNNVYFTKRVDASKAILIKNKDEKTKPYWKFYNVTIREFDENGLIKYIQHYKEYDLVLEENLETFLSVEKKPEDLNFLELWRYISILESQGAIVDYYPDLYLKISFPFSALILILIALPFAFKVKSGEMLLGFGIGIMIAICYYGTTAFFLTISKMGVVPSLIAVWLPNIVFACIGLYMFKKFA